MRAALLAGEDDFTRLERNAIDELAAHGWQSDYIAIRQQADLAPARILNTPLVILAASRLGSTRLIDNIEI